MSPIDTALWWTDYVLKHEDTAYLRPAGNDQYLFIRRQIDVWGTLSIAAFIILIYILKLVIALYKRILFVKPKKQ